MTVNHRVAGSSPAWGASFCNELLDFHLLTEKPNCATFVPICFKKSPNSLSNLLPFTLLYKYNYIGVFLLFYWHKLGTLFLCLIINSIISIVNKLNPMIM